ncbi:MAG: MFS transporter [Bryobacteraceae bacterium]
MIRYSIVLLALLINVICYTDRSCISIAGPSMQKEFSLSPTQMGLVYSIFSLSYFAGQTPWGLVADRYGARWLVAFAITGWSIFTGLTSLAASFPMLLGIRLVFGALEAALSPSIATAFGRWIPVTERSSAFGFFLGGGRLGGAITPLIAAPVLLDYGWRSMFVIFASLGFVAVGAWLAWFRDDPARHARVSSEELETIRRDTLSKSAVATDWGRLLRSPRLWCLLAVSFGCTFLWQFFITWFPTYLMKDRGMGLQEAARYSSLPFFFGVFATWVGGLLTDALSKRWDPRRARKVIGSTALAVASVLISAGIWCSEPRMAAVLMASAAIGVDLFLGAAWTSALDIGGSSGGAVAGMMNAASNCAGFASPTFTGWVVQTWNSWNVFLAAAAAINLCASLLWLRVQQPDRS